MNISEGIQAQMARTGVASLTSLARRTGLNQPTLYKIISGETEDPRISTLLALAKFFDVNVEELIGAGE